MNNIIRLSKTNEIKTPNVKEPESISKTMNESFRCDDFCLNRDVGCEDELVQHYE